MKKIVLASHGKLAEGLLDTLILLGADTSFVEPLTFYCECGATEDDITRVLREAGEETQLIVFTDIMFGSVNQLFLRLATKMAKTNVRIITGFNLPVVMGVIAAEDPLTDEELYQMVKDGKEQMMLMSKDVLSEQTSCDDIFEE